MRLNKSNLCKLWPYKRYRRDIYNVSLFGTMLYHLCCLVSSAIKIAIWNNYTYEHRLTSSWFGLCVCVFSLQFFYDKIFFSPSTKMKFHLCVCVCVRVGSLLYNFFLSAYNILLLCHFGLMQCTGMIECCAVFKYTCIHTYRSHHWNILIFSSGFDASTQNGHTKWQRFASNKWVWFVRFCELWRRWLEKRHTKSNTLTYRAMHTHSSSDTVVVAILHGTILSQLSVSVCAP